MSNDKQSSPNIPDSRPTIDEERMMHAFNAALSQQDTKLREHVSAEIAALEKAAFPEGDVHGHKTAHEKQIKRANRWDDIKAEFISKAFTSGLLAATGFVLLLVWEYIKSGGQK